MTERQMILGVEIGNGYGTQPGSWRASGVDPTNYVNFDALVRYAQAAERGCPSSDALAQIGVGFSGEFCSPLC